MSDDEADPELLELLREKLGLGVAVPPSIPETRVLEGAEWVYENSIDVALDAQKTQAAAEGIWQLMQSKEYSAKTWSTHELHPKTKDESTVDFIFTMDLLNFSFWSEKSLEDRFAIEYRGKRWTGYWSLVAALQRALEEEIPITSPEFWIDEDKCTEEVLKTVFRSVTEEEIPLFQERLHNLREAGKILCEEFDGSFLTCIEEANGSAAALVNLVAQSFPCFNDETRFEGKAVRLYKRAQILVADMWACFEGQSYGEFDDIDKITVFAGMQLSECFVYMSAYQYADYRIPQILHSLGCLLFSPPLESHIRSLKMIDSGSSREVQVRGCTIWCVELIRRTIARRHPEAKVNAILIDFFLYDSMKEREEAGEECIPHHRTRSIWY
ncbi:MAG: hypothetical protein M1834_004222 [Cirrosporium novae-zelandiae]|nr:MAG: hypothetical protein M1834_004222 [Cirrosporium novae-zelandiae]